MHVLACLWWRCSWRQHDLAHQSPEAFERTSPRLIRVIGFPDRKVFPIGVRKDGEFGGRRNELVSTRPCSSPDVRREDARLPLHEEAFKLLSVLPSIEDGSDDLTHPTYGEVENLFVRPPVLG